MWKKTMTTCISKLRNKITALKIDTMKIITISTTVICFNWQFQHHILDEWFVFFIYFTSQMPVAIIQNKTQSHSYFNMLLIEIASNGSAFGHCSVDRARMFNHLDAYQTKKAKKTAKLIFIH